MSEPKILITGTCYIPDEGKRELALLWGRVARHLNPGTDIVLIDSASPFDPRQFMPPAVEVIRYPESIGAISQGQRDGAGRSFCKSLEIAAERGYDYCVVIEADMILAQSVIPIVGKMHRVGVNVAAPLAVPYQFPEWGCSFWSTKYVRDSNFTERYDWEHAPKWPIPEWRIQKLVEDEFFLLPVHGSRNEDNRLNIANIANHFPYYPPGFLTHCADFSLYYRMLDMNKIVLS